jgi:hypothetical protein
MRTSSETLRLITPEQGARLGPGLRILLEAFKNAAAAQRKPWDFAVKRAALRAAGLTPDDMRWLFARKLVQHAVEKTKPGSKRRVFGRRGKILLHVRSCFVLTEEGEHVARVLLGEIPFYDRDESEVWARGLLVKDFQKPAPDQDAILSSFEELGWQRRIDDPLPPKHGRQNSKLRLRDAIKRLNQRHKHNVIRFHGDRTGKGIRWKFVDEAAS